MSKINVAVIQLNAVKSNLNAQKAYLNTSLNKKYLDRFNIEKIKQEQISRMCEIIRSCATRGVNFIIFPELALTSFFPYFHFEDETTLNKYFEKGNITKGVAREMFMLAKKLNIALGFGYAELTSENKKYNTYIIYDVLGRIHKYRKVHIPGFSKPSPNKPLFQFEKGIFFSSNEGYPVFRVALKINNKIVKVKTGITICHDRRYSAPYLSMGMKGAQIIINGYNTPKSLSFQKSLDDFVYRFHYLPLQAQAITEGVYILSSGRTGNNFGIEQIAGSCIVSPFGELVSKSENEKEEILFSSLDLDACNEVKAQKYWGDRSRYDLLLSEMVSHLGLSIALSSIKDKFTYEDIISSFALHFSNEIKSQERQEDYFIEDWKYDANTSFYISKAIEE